MNSLQIVNFYPTMGDGFLLPTLAAVFVGGTSVFGGRGSVYGTFLGAFMIGAIQAGIVAVGPDRLLHQPHLRRRRSSPPWPFTPCSSAGSSRDGGWTAGRGASATARRPGRRRRREPTDHRAAPGR